MATANTAAATVVEQESRTYEWMLIAEERQGNLWLRWKTSAPFRAWQDQVVVYAGQRFPSDPNSDKKEWRWADQQPAGGWDTTLRSGSDWYCAWIAQSNQGNYVYVVQLVTKKPPAE
jgi:hypothetical protein